jgi:hypothetical protein
MPSKFFGVTWNKARHQWVARINSDGKVIHLGYFQSEIEAARAVDAGQLKHRGQFAKLNIYEEAQ